MGEKYLLSVDGGGTKTEFCISSIKDQTMKSYITGSTNFKSVGIAEARRNMKQGFDWLTKTQGIPPEDIIYAVFGISGCDSEKDNRIIKEEILKEDIPEGKCYLCNDGVLGFYAQAQGEGLVIIAGTGSIVIGIDKQGKSIRSGGWGYHFSDAGSGYWIGCEVLKETLLYCDGCREYSELFEEIRKYFHAENYEDLPYIITGLSNYLEIAKVAVVVVEMAEKGQEDAIGILRRGAGLLAVLAESTYRKCGFTKEQSIPIVFSGGVLKSRKYEEMLKEALAERMDVSGVEFHIQKNTPVYGGIRLAEQMIKRA